MKKIIFVVLSLFLFSACSVQQKNNSIIEAIKSEGIKTTQIDSPKETELDDIKPLSYKLENNEVIRVYEFDSIEKRELGKKRFQEYQAIRSPHAPIIYQPNNYLVLYYSNATSTTQTPKFAETQFGDKIEKAINSMK